MPVAFGKNDSRQIPGVGEFLAGDGETLLRLHRERERKRMGPPLDRATRRDYERLQVYIYNIGPFMRKMDALGSGGVKIIPALEEKDVLKPLAVSEPLVVAAFPESYPSEPSGRFLTKNLDEHLKWTEADGEVHILADHVSIDEALNIIGAHEQSRKSPYSATPYEQGCFVSTVPKQTEPKAPREPGEKAGRGAIREFEKAMIAYEDDLRFWNKWVANWNAAAERFTSWAMRRGEEQCLAYANGKYVRDEELFVLSRIFHKTESDWPFLAGVSANVKSKACWSCGRAMKADLPKCQCGELQISPAEYAALREKHTGVAA